MMVYTAMVRINAHAQLSRQNENAQAAIMVSLVACGRPTEAFSNKVGLCHERTLPENFWKKFHPLAKEDMLSAEWIVCTVKIR